jgi:hypothetical protein
MEQNYFQLREFGTVVSDILLDSDITFTGENFFAHLKLDDLTCTGQSTFTNPPQSLEQQIDIPRDHLVTKEYVDSVNINGGKNFYLNYSVTDPVYTLYKELSPSVAITAQQSISTLALGTNLLAQFISPVLNLTRLQSGLFTLNQFGSRTETQGTVQFYFQIYLSLTNTLVGTSGLSNNVSNSIDLFTMVFNLTSNIEIIPLERLVLKLFSVGTSTNTSNVTAFFEGGEYSFLTTTINKSSDLLTTDNEWSGQNYFENPPNDPKEIATTETISFSMTDTSNTFTNDNYFLTKTSPNGTTAVATTAYCDNLILTNFSANNLWGTHIFTDETNSLNQLATCKYVQSKVYLPNLSNTFTGINTFPTPIANSQEPASTKYVKDKFSTGILSSNNAFTGTSTTWTKSSPTGFDIATTKYMRDRFLNYMSWGPNIQCRTVTTSGITLANTAATRTITNARKASLLAGNNSLNNVELITEATTDNSTRIATNEYVQNSSFSSLLSSVNDWTQDQNFITQVSTSSNTRMATTAFLQAMTFSMIGYNITGVHTVITAPTAQTGTQIANLDYTIANKPNLDSFLNISNTWSGTVTFPTASTGTSTRQVATTAFVKGVFNTDLLNANTWSGINLLPLIVGTTNNSTRGATTASISNYFSAFMPFFSSSFPTSEPINLTGTCLTPSPSTFLIDTQVANCLYVNTQIVPAFENAGNGAGIEFTVNQRCPTRLTASTYLANTTFVDEKKTQYFSSILRNLFKAAPHTWSAGNLFTYALSTLDNSNLGATCSYVTENFNQSKNYLGAITFASQPFVARTSYPSLTQEIGYTRTFTGIDASLTTGFNTLINFGTIEIGNYIFSVKETVTVTSATNALNVINFFWGPSTALAEQNFSQFTGSNAWNVAPNILNYAQRFNAGVTTYHRVFVVAFVNASTVVHSVRLTGTFGPITSVRSDVTITKIA